MRSRFVGGILLIVGTSIGGGMLALPIANASVGFWRSTIVLLLCWAFMTLGAFFILEANLYLPRGKHMVSMAAATLGTFGLVTAWISYLFLLYTLLSAYISGGSDVLNSLLSALGFHFRDSQASLLFTFLFGLIVCCGIHSVDWANRTLMCAKLAVYFVLILFIAPYININYYQHGNLSYIGGSIMILITSFGFAIIVPNLRDYFDDDLPTLKKVILMGSVIPLLCYIAWDAVIMGTLPATGPQGLESLMANTHTTSMLANILTAKVHSAKISALFNFFTSICMLTAFLGVSLCLYSFLADGLKVPNHGKHTALLFSLTFIPPLLLVLYYPGAYLYALNYAGIFCIILLLLLPALMCYFGRNYYTTAFQVPGGKITPLGVIVTSLVLLGYELYKLITY